MLLASPGSRESARYVMSFCAHGLALSKDKRKASAAIPDFLFPRRLLWLLKNEYQRRRVR